MNYLKAEIIEWNKRKFQDAYNLCKEYKSTPQQFKQALELAESYLKILGPETYQAQAKMLREMIKGNIIDEVAKFIEEYKAKKDELVDFRYKFADRFEKIIDDSMEKPEQLKECI